MPNQPNLKPAAELAKANGVRFPNKTKEYRAAPDALLTQWDIAFWYPKSKYCR